MDWLAGIGGYWIGLMLLIKILCNGDYNPEKNTIKTLTFTLYVHVPWIALWSWVFWRFIHA